MKKLLSNIILFLCVIISFASCTSNDEVEPDYPTQGAINYHYFVRTVGEQEKQIVSIYSTVKSEKLEDLKLFSIGKNQLINVYLQDGSIAEILTEEEGGNLYDIIYRNGFSIEDIGFKVQTYLDRDGNSLLFRTSIQVVHEFLEK